MNRAFSMLEIKGLDEDQRIITGIATTPQPDRVGDIVDPMGAMYQEEIPLLWMHKHDKAVGIANLGKPTKSGIPFRAIIAKIDEDGELKSMLNYVWQSVKAGLVKGVSIGFLPKEYEPLKGGGLHFKKSEIYELSLTPLPMNANATIQSVKAMSGYRDNLGSIPLIDRLPEKTIDLGGAVKLISASRLASLPLKAN